MKSTLILLALPFILLSTFGGNVALNNWRLHRFATQLYAYPLPDGASIESTEEKIGVLVGNGNHCDFAAILRIQSDWDRKEIENHYESLRLIPAHKQSGRWPLLYVSPTDETAYIIKILDSNYTRWFDMRCG